MSPKTTKQDEQDLEDELSLLDRLYLEHEKDVHEENRVSPRTRLVKIGELAVGDEKYPCFIVDLSRSGTKIRTLDPLDVEPSSVRLHITDIGVFDAEVRWVDGTEIGLLLHGEIEAPEEHESAAIEDVIRVQNK